MLKVVIANKLADGFVAFLSEDGAWSQRIADAAVADGEAAAAALLERARADERANVVVDPCLIDVTLRGNEPCPVEYREYIRAYGPSVSLPSQL